MFIVASNQAQVAVTSRALQKHISKKKQVVYRENRTAYLVIFIGGAEGDYILALIQ